MNNLSPARMRLFQKKIYRYYTLHRRSFPWRETRNPYHILVSEIMLQQTHVDRVTEKYREFILQFPSFRALACAPFRKILNVWQGMGYNRRALYLKEIAVKATRDFNGRCPRDPDVLASFPGIGHNTAASICAFAFNRPVVFVETNIRAVFIHEFFVGKEEVDDIYILPLVQQTLDSKNPRTWYNALMDYGVMLKKQYNNPARRSVHYQKQSSFEGSNRQLRGRIIRLLTLQPHTVYELCSRTGVEGPAVTRNLHQLKKEGFVREKGSVYCIKE